MSNEAILIEDLATAIAITELNSDGKDDIVVCNQLDDDITIIYSINK